VDVAVGGVVAVVVEVVVVVVLVADTVPVPIPIALPLLVVAVLQRVAPADRGEGLVQRGHDGAGGHGAKVVAAAGHGAEAVARQVDEEHVVPAIAERG